MRVAFVSNQAMLDVGGALYSPIASLRRELLLPAQCLAARGIQTHVISLASWPREHALALLAKSDRVVFGKVFEYPANEGADRFAVDTAAYAALLAAVDLRDRLAFCFADDHLTAPHFEAFYRQVASISRVWICSSEALAETLRPLAKCPVRVYPEPAEVPAASVRVPHRGLRERLGVWMARRSRVGLDPWRLKLLWFGHPSNAQPLLQLLPSLRDFAERVPLALECVTQPTAELASIVTPAAASPQSALRIGLTPWALEFMPHALADCDVVVLPQLVDDPQKRSKSNNRLVDALQAGRFVVAHPLPSYEELRDFCWIGDSIPEGLNWLLRHPKAALTRIVSGQRFLEKHHSLDALGDFWIKALAL